MPTAPGSVRVRLRASSAAAVTAVALAAGTLAAAVSVGPGVSPALGATGGGHHVPTQSQVDASRQRAARLDASLAGRRLLLARDQVALNNLLAHAEARVEAYQAAQVRLVQARQRAAVASHDARRAATAFATSQVQLGQYAAEQYMSGGVVGPVLALVAATPSSDVLGQAATLTVLADRQRHLVDQARASSIVNDVMQQRAATEVHRVGADTRRLAAARDAAQAALQQQQAQIDVLTARINRLSDALGTARTQVADLSAARNAWLDQQAAAQPPSQPAGSGSGPTPDPTPTSTPDPSPPPPSGSGAAAAVAYARAQLGKPYVYGASGPDSFDCSGLTMRAWEAAGVTLYHSAIYQYAQSTPVTRAQARPGDLVFFADGPKYTDIYHVGLYVGGGTMIEAPYTGEVVRYASVDRSSLFGFARP